MVLPWLQALTIAFFRHRFGTSAAHASLPLPVRWGQDRYRQGLLTAAKAVEEMATSTDVAGWHCINITSVYQL
jgi:hypothetical protein